MARVLQQYFRLAAGAQAGNGPSLAGSLEPDIYLLIEAGHECVEQIFDEIERAASFPQARRDRLVERLKVTLERHLLAEDTVFYNHLSLHRSLRELIQSARLEHAHLRRLLREFETRAAGSEWEQRLQELRHLAESHFVEEEMELFEAARAVLSDQRAAELAREMQSALDGATSASAL